MVEDVLDGREPAGQGRQVRRTHRHGQGLDHKFQRLCPLAGASRVLSNKNMRQSEINRVAVAGCTEQRGTAKPGASQGRCEGLSSGGEAGMTEEVLHQSHSAACVKQKLRCQGMHKVQVGC